ncbi:MAG TPA: hypothetical protein VFE25_02055 [Opitutaceae bacterium]|nr:hypothetical protein [Opitutaceae bacterium]
MKTQKSTLTRIPAALGVLACAVLALSVCGCAELTGKPAQAKKSKPFEPTNHFGEASLPARMHRVVLMPVAGGNAASPESAAALDPVIVSCLQRQNRFEVIQLTRADCQAHFQCEELSSVMPLPTNFMEVLKRDYDADAVIFVDVTVYQAYQPLQIGLRAKLAMLDDSHLVWTFDNLYSAEDAAVAGSATKYLQSREPVMLPPDISTVVLESPSQFAGYVVSSMFATLPPVHGTAAVAKVARKAENER